MLADSGGAGFGGDGRVGSTTVMAVVQETCSPVSSMSGRYDCAGPAGALAAAAERRTVRRGLIRVPAMPPAPSTRQTPSARARRASLNLVLTVAIIDGLLLLVLLYVAFVNRSDSAVSVLGPIHGLGYVYLLYLTATGAGRGMWGWWFPGVVLITGGPLGSILGEMRLRREL